ncbi:MAG: hypothetical protein H6719_02820 [Sandaracinaceae bacterium]|nr:hypothetical protein [Sandaracinaceae bacterium]
MFRAARLRPWLATAALVAIAVPGCILDRSGTAPTCTLDSQCSAPAVCVDGRCVLGSVDAGMDAAVDGGPRDGGDDAGFDGGLDAAVDGGSDAGSDGGSDAGSDAGFDAGVELDPRTIPGLVLWLHSESLRRGALTEWPDDSDEMHVVTAHRTPPVVATESGVRVVQFDGSGHFITDSVRWGGGSTIFLVARIAGTSVTNTRILHSDDVSNHFALERRMGTTTSIVVSGVRGEAALVPDELFHLYEVIDDTTTELLVDGVTEATVPRAIVSRSRAMGIGGNPVTNLAGNELTGAIAELLVWDSALSAADRAAVEAYLQARWAALL